MDKTEYQAQLLSNRLIKRYKHLKKWAKRNNITCYRLYDKDIPEIPLSIDLYQSITTNTGLITTDISTYENTDQYIQIALYERPYEKDEAEETQWLNAMVQAISYTLVVPNDRVIIKTRKHQHGDNQYEKMADKKLEFIVQEQHQLFLVNLSDYLDTGLFFDHRPLRLKVRTESKKKRVLNLFCYTGAFSVYAATGKAASVQSVDLSTNYLNWAKRNFELNGLNPEDEKYTFTSSDVLTFLKKTIANKNIYDLIILDPPTFSNSKKTDTTLDILKDWPELVNLCIQILSPGGTLYFSTNSRRLTFDESKLIQYSTCCDITESTIPEDYRNQHIHRAWEITK